MKPNLELIAHEIKELGRSVKDDAVLANFINRCHGTNYFASDIEKIRMGLRPNQSIPRNMAGVKVVVGDPLPVAPPLTTLNDKGFDPLAIACLEYGVKHGGVMGASANDCHAMLKVMAA